MLLSVRERIQVLGLLPREGNVFLLRMIQETTKAVGFTEKELKLLNFVTDGGVTKWKLVAPLYVDVALGEKARDLVCEKLKELDKTNKLPLEMLPLHDRLVEGKESDDLREFRRARGKVVKLVTQPEAESAAGG